MSWRDLVAACVVLTALAGCRVDVPNAAGYSGDDSTFGTSQGPGDGGTSTSGGVEPSTQGLDSTAAVSDSASGSSGSSSTTTSADTGSSTDTGVEPGMGHAGSAFVNAGAASASPSYSMVWTFGQQSQVQNAMTSPSYRLRGGFIGAVADE